jgi:hypothetical protein
MKTRLDEQDFGEYKMRNFGVLPNNNNDKPEKQHKVQGISGFGRFFSFREAMSIKFRHITHWLSGLGFRDSFLLTLAVGTVLLFAAWQLASRPVPADQQQMSEEIEFLGNEVAVLRGKLDRAMDRQAVLERESTIQREANRLLQQDETRRQAEVDRLQSQLDFYQRLAGAAGTREGLDVYGFELVPVSTDGLFQFVLTLTQNIRRASIIDGKVGITMEGRRDNRPVTLYWPQLTDGNTPEPAFRFKYFQQLEGYIALPVDFEPVQLHVTLDTGHSRTSLKKSYSWNTLTGAAAQGY